MSKYSRIATDEITVDARYQRPVEENRVNKIAENFDPTLFGVLEVSRRNGKCAVFDGQHRLEAAKRISMEKVPCLVHEGLSPEQEASLFVQLQRERKNINPVDRFKARLFYGDETAVAINDVAEDAGYEIHTSSSESSTDNYRIKAVSALERAYKLHGAEHLHHTLTTLRDWWGGDKKSTDGAFIEGLALFLRQYDGTIREDHIEALRQVAPMTLIRRATGPMGGGGSQMSWLVAGEMKKAAGIRGKTPKLERKTAA